MKVNIKGLVFTGFAAAILSANAMAANTASDINTVTSKSYVDAKVVNNLDSSATDKAPSQGAVNTALATKQPIQSDSSYKVGQSNTWQPLNSAVAVSGYLAKTDETNGSVTLNIDTANQLQTDGSSLTSGSSKLITEGAVAAAIAANGGAVNSGVLTVEQNNVQIGQFNANDSTSPTIDIVAPSWDATSTDAGYIDGKPTIATTSTSIDSAEATDTKVLPTTYAVQQYVNSVASGIDSEIDTLESAVNTALAGKQTKSDATAGTYKVGHTGDTWATLGTAGYVQIDATNTAAPAIQLDSAQITSSSVLTSTSTKLTREQDVYGAIQAATGGTVIPARNELVCTDSTPCALVYEADGAHWRTMATATDSGGVLGDAQ